MEVKKRFYLIDAIRAVAVISMVAFHFSYDVFMVYGVNTDWYRSLYIRIWQQSICWTFIFISGFVWKLGKKKFLKRGLFIKLCGMIISVVTLIVEPSEVIWFGVLTFIGMAILIMYPVEKVANKIQPVAGFIVSFVFFLLFKNIQDGYLGIGNWRLELPRTLYDIKVLMPIGLPSDDFASSDYFPVIPWFFLYLCGYFASEFVLKSEKIKKLLSVKIPVLSFVGTKAIWIYMLHQPICMLICMVIFS